MQALMKFALALGVLVCAGGAASPSQDKSGSRFLIGDGRALHENMDGPAFRPIDRPRVAPYTDPPPAPESPQCLWRGSSGGP